MVKKDTYFILETKSSKETTVERPDSRKQPGCYWNITHEYCRKAKNIVFGREGVVTDKTEIRLVFNRVAVNEILGAADLKR